MTALICGSLAFDTITQFHGRFAQHILPEQIHILNVSFLVPTLRKEFGGCAGNIAYTLKMLGDQPLIAAALGQDAPDYVARIEQWGLSKEFIHMVPNTHTAQALITTDLDNNQINAFHPGAMQFAHQNDLRAVQGASLGIIAPDGREAMIEHAKQMTDMNIPFIFDPGQGLPMFNAEELQQFIDQATWVAVNDYEAKLLCDRLQTSLQELSRQSHLQALFVTLGAQGCEVWIQGEKHLEPGVKASAVLDPTGCGDSFRAALLYGLKRQWHPIKCARLGNRVGALKVAVNGPQNHQLDQSIFENLD